MSVEALPRFRAENVRGMLRHGLITVVFCCFIAAALAITQHGDWGAQMVYSLSIGLISWLFIDVGRLLISGHREILWPSGPWGYLLVAGGVTVGFLGGNAIGDAWTHQPLLDFGSFTERKLATTIIITVTATVCMCFFFYSLGRSKHMRRQIDLAQRNATEARLKLLETQLEPHMLFNTLANLRALITADPPRAVAMLDRLNNYLRMTLSGSRALAHPLAAEFERLADYLELMSVRMGERLRYTLDLPDELRGTPVPPLLLQPLVENAIKHGVEPSPEGAKLRIRTERRGSVVVIEVVNSLPPLRWADEPLPRGHGIALANVRDRLRLLHDMQMQFSAGMDQKNYRVRIAIPAES